jgi:hypothetical protein
MRSIVYLSIASIIFTSACSGASEDQEQGAGETEGNQCILQPGEYQVEYSVVSDTCNSGPLATELFVVASNGQAIANPDPPAGCIDEVVFNDGCQVGLTRTCSFFTESADIDAVADFVYDFERGTGTVRIDLRGYYPGTDILGQVCQTTQRARISQVN